MVLQVDCPSTWTPGAEVLFLGEAPGEDECWQQQGWVGKAGQILERQCNLGGLSFERCSRSNVAKRRPPANKFSQAFYRIIKHGKSKKNEPTEELLQWHEQLREDLKAHPHSVVVACGNEALWAMCGTRQITKRQGSVYESSLLPGQKVIAMQHPSAILQGQTWQDVWIGVHIVRNIVVPESKFPEIRRREWEEILAPDAGTVLRFLHWLSQIPRRWCIDIETRGGSISCVGVGVSDGVGEKALVIPIQTTTGPFYTRAEEQAIWEQLQRTADANHNLILHNAPYDFEWLMDYGFVPGGMLMDTMTAHHRLYPELPKKLEFTNFFYATGIPYYKDEGKTWGSRTPNEQEWKYNAKDLIATLRQSYPIEERLKARGLWQHYREKDLAALPIALEMQRRPWIIEDSGLELAQKVVESEIIGIQDSLNKLAQASVNINSPKDVPALLYGKCGFPHLYGKHNADEDVLVTLKTWLAGQQPKKHTKHCGFGKKKCQHRSAEQLKYMADTLECVMRLRKLLKAKSSYLDDGLYRKE